MGQNRMISDVHTLALPYLCSLRNRLRFRERGDRLKTGVLGGLGLAFWGGLFYVFYWVLSYFAGVEIFGPILARKLLSMVFLTFFFVLIFSNMVTALSTFYLSEDLHLLMSAPVSLSRLYGMKLAETLVSSSWMVITFALPVFLAYAVVFRVGVGYFLQLIGVGIPFILIPACVGTMMTMMMVLAFPARRMKDILFVMGLVFFIFLFVLLRMLRPERLVDREVVQGLMEYIATIQAPSSALLPSYWATEALSPFLFPREYGDGTFYLLMLLSTGLAMLVLGRWLTRAAFFTGWSKAQESKRLSLARLRIIDRIVLGLPAGLSQAWRGLVIKDVKTFFRETTQWSQLLLLLALVVIYLYNFSVLPLKQYPLPSFLTQNIISFLNLALAGFVLSAIGARFVFPAVSLEGRAVWIIRSAPVSVESFLWAKFWVGLVPLLVMAEILVLVTNYLLDATPFMTVLSVVTILLITLGIVSLGVGLGASFPRFAEPNPANIPTGFGGIVYMITCMSYIGCVVLMVAWPAYLYLKAKYYEAPLPEHFWYLTGGVFTVLMIANAILVWLPIRLGTRHLTEMEI